MTETGVVDMPLRAIADLHGAYGAGVSLDMRYSPRTDEEGGYWYVHMEATSSAPNLMIPGGPDMLSVSFFDTGQTYVREGRALATFDTDSQAYAYRGFCLAVEAVRVWLHQHGGKR